MAYIHMLYVCVYIYISQFDIPIIYLNDTVQEIHQLVTIVN